MRRFPSSRTKGIRLTQYNSSNEASKIRKSLDVILKADYQMLRQSNRGQNRILECGACSSSPLIMDYVREIYEEYGFQDPLGQDQPMKIRTESDRGDFQQKSMQRLMNQEENHRKSRHRRGVSQFSYNTPGKDESTIINTTTGKLFDASQHNVSADRSQHYYQTHGITITSSKALNYNPSRESAATGPNQKKNPKISQIFRFCLACQSSILQGNIQIHQAQCPQFSILYTMDIPQILNYLTTRISKVQRQLQEKTQRLSNQDPNDFRRSVGVVLNQSEKILQEKSQKHRDNFNQQYRKAIQIGQKWERVAFEMEKLNWFVTMKENIRKRFNY